MDVSRYIKRTTLILGSLVLFFIVVTVVVLAIGYPVNLNGIRAKVENAASEAIGRKVSIGGDLAFDLSFWPTIELRDLQIANPSSWETKNFVKVNLFRAQIRILPLLRRSIHIQEITADGINVQLENKADGAKNWLFDVSKDEAKSSTPAKDSGEAIKVELVQIDELLLQKIAVSFRDHESDKTYKFVLNEMKGAAVADEELHLELKGLFQRQNYYIDISGDPIGELFRPTQTWHLKASAEMAGLTLNVSGQADRPLEGKGIDVLLKLNGDRFARLATTFGAKLPAIGAYALQARIKKMPKGFNLSELKGNFGQTTFNGELDVNLAGEKPAILAKLNIPTLDAGPLQEISSVEPDSIQKPSDNQEALPPLEELKISLDILNLFDADAELEVTQLINAPGDIRNATLKVAIHEGVLSAPMAVTFADVAFRGELDLKHHDDGPGFVMRLAARQTDLGRLALAFTNTEGIEGHLASFDLSLKSKGHNLQSLFDNLDMQFALTDAALTYGNVAGGRPVRFTLKKAEIVLPHGRNMNAAVAGSLLNVPFDLKLAGGTLNQILSSEPWPVVLAANGGGAKLRLKGSIAEPDDPNGTNIQLQVNGKRLGDLEAWLGISPSAKMSYALNGKFKLTPQQWEMSSLIAHLGQTKLKGHLGWKKSDIKPLLMAKLKLENVNPGELGSIAATDKSRLKNEPDAEGFTFDMPIMPRTVEFNDADIDININRIPLRTFNIANVSLTSRIRDGWVDSSPFQATIEDVQFKGTLSLDLRSRMPQFKFKIASSKVNIGGLLAELNIAEGIDAAVGSLELDLRIKGNDLRTILDQSEFAASMKSGHWTIQDPNTSASLKIRVLECVVKASAGQPVTWSIDGRIKDKPVKIMIKGDRLAALAAKKVRLPLDITAEAAGVKLQLSSVVDLPIEQKEVDFKMVLSGKRLNSINTFLEVNLPPYGPYELGGRFQLKKTGYYLSDLNMRVNQSHMTGKMSLETAARPPRLAIDLTTRTLRIDDFKADDWSPLRVASEDAGKDTAGETAAKQASNGQNVQSLLSPQFMSSLEARFDLKVREVLSGKDNLGSGSLSAGLEKGRFFVDPLLLKIPGGSVNIAFAFKPIEAEVALETHINVEQFDYGILARRIRPDSDMGGWLSLDIDLQSRAKNLDTIMHSANGYIDFALVPENFEANLFELWAVNLLTAVLPKLDSEATSKVNCAVFRLNLKDGKLTEDAIFADTTKMQVGGEAKLNFKTEEVYLALAPKAKKPEFFSLATPIQVKGSFSDYKIGVKPGGLVGTAVRFITSPIVVPIQRIFAERAPVDGKAACSAAMHRPHE